jgi:hypothetical protein
MLASQEAKIRNIVVRSQPWANSFPDPILKIPNTHACTRAHTHTHTQTHTHTYTHTKELASGVAQELLPSKHEALSSNPSTVKWTTVYLLPPVPTSLCFSP